MTPQELKNSILQLAIQGKLVEQCPEEGTAEELYRQIQAEKQTLIQTGKIKKEKPLPEITDDEKPFDIPESWMWVRLRNIAFNRGQETPAQPFCYIDIGSIDNKRQLLNESESIIEPQNAPSRARKIVEKGDILYSTVRPYLHNMCIVDRDFSQKPIASTGFAAIVCHKGVFIKYLFYYLMAPAFDNYANDTENAKGVAYPAINDDRLYRAVIALPPLAEQKRIVAKIEELLPLIDRYEQAWTRLEDFNKRFPTDMQKSLLQLAISGKLVEQRPEEGTGEELYRQIQAEKQALIKTGKLKKDKPLPEITEDESDIDIPDSWTLCKLEKIANKITDGEHKTPRRVTSYCGYYLLSARNIRDGYISVDDVDYVDEEEYAIISKRCNPKKGDVLISCSGSVGRCAVVKDSNNYVMVRSAAMISPIAIDSDYLRFTIQSEYVQRQIRERKKQTAQANLFQDAICNLVIPLPPLAEQKRIVAKLEELLPLCEKLK